MDPASWMLENDEHFSREMNGYLGANSAMGPYLSTLPLIDRDGRIADLGCGNGMLLKFLIVFSGHDLAPYGIDSSREAVAEARSKILPGYAENLFVADIDEPGYEGEPFDIIIANPFHSSEGPVKFTEKCRTKLSPGGKLIYRVHTDVLEHNGISGLDDYEELTALGVRPSSGYGIVFGTLEKPSK